MNKKEYRRLLKDIRWLNKRKVILERDHNKCVLCGSEFNLNVHHSYYILGVKPWDYPDESLVTLCEQCHLEYHKTHKIQFKKLKNKKQPPKTTKNNKKQSRLFKHATRKPRICLAEIQANKDNFIKLRDGTWVRKKNNK